MANSFDRTWDCCGRELGGADHDDGPGLVGFLDRLAGMEATTEHGFLTMYLQSHPPTALRIDRLEQQQEMKAAA
ncbi:MAG: hypothetical protein ACR2QH_03980 [Geminicoccaceae bacterium]